MFCVSLSPVNCRTSDACMCTWHIHLNPNDVSYLNQLSQVLIQRIFPLFLVSCHNSIMPSARLLHIPSAPPSRDTHTQYGSVLHTFYPSAHNDAVFHLSFVWIPMFIRNWPETEALDLWRCMDFLTWLLNERCSSQQHFCFIKQPPPLLFFLTVCCHPHIVVTPQPMSLLPVLALRIVTGFDIRGTNWKRTETVLWSTLGPEQVLTYSHMANMLSDSTVHIHQQLCLWYHVL